MFADKKIEIAEFEVNKDYGDDEMIFRLNTPQGEVTLTKLKFQIGQPLPDTLSVRIKGSDKKGLPLVGHHMARYVSEFYADGFQRGDEFEFKVVAMPPDDMGYYRLEDANGLTFKLRETRSILTLGQSVRCRFETLNQTFFSLRRSSADTDLPMFHIKDLLKGARLIGFSHHNAEAQIRRIPELEQAMTELDNGYPSWILTALKAVRAMMPRWFRDTVRDRRSDSVRPIITGLRKIVLFLLQGSGFLRNIHGSERANLQNLLTSQIEQIDAYIEAYEIICRKGETAFIGELLSNLKESGYLFHPNMQFAIMMIFFRMSPELVNTSLGNIFDTLMGWDPSTWKTEPFRQAFVEQLEMFISEKSSEISGFIRPETGAENELIEKMLTAIAIQQSLVNDTDNVDLRRNLSQFYRYLSLLRQARAEALLHKSYLTIMGTRLPTDFTWNDIKESTMMMTRATVDAPANAVITTPDRWWADGDIEVQFGADGITIERLGDNAEAVIPNGILQWPGLQVVTKIAKGLNRQKIKSIEGHDEFWKDVEAALFTPRENPTEAVTSRHADIDDVVRIIIDRVNHTPDGYLFHCKIVDEHFIDTEGFLRADEIAPYNLHNIVIGHFRHSNGRPMMFDATVKDIDENDRIHFSLLDTTRRAIRNMANNGDTSFCVITKDNGTSYSALSEEGYGLYLAKEEKGQPPFHIKNVVRARVTGYTSAVQAVIEEGPVDSHIVDNATAFHRLLGNIAVYDPEAETEDADLDDADLMPLDDIRQIIDIFHYKAISLPGDIIAAFDYLSYARLLAIIIKDDEKADMLRAHKEMLLLHQFYAKNKRIAADDIDSALALAPASTLISRMARRLSIVACLGNDEANPALWDDSATATSDTDRQLAQMVLSYNFLTKIDPDDTSAAAIKERIAHVLNVETDQHTLKYYGSESQYVEFKSSIVYPARKGRAGTSAGDPDRQEFEILHIIAGFLNSTGGTLYLGVGDDHYERGLAEDFNFYKLDRSEKNTPRRRSIQSLDNLANHISNLIDHSFSIGAIAGDYAKVEIDDESTKGVIAIKITPCFHPVYLNGELFVRHSAKTEPLTDQAAIEMFLKDRRALYAQQNAASTNLAPTPTAPAAKQNATPAQAAEPASAQNSQPDQYSAPTVENAIATSTTRRNILHDYEDYDHFVAPKCYMRFVGDNSYIITDQEWSLEDETPNRLVLTIMDDEADGYLLLVYADDYAIKVPVREILQKKFDTPHTYFADRRLLFAAPVGKDHGLYTLHCKNGSLYERMTAVAKIPSGSITAAPTRLLEAECDTTPIIEAVPAKHLPEFKNISSDSMKRTQLGSLAKGVDSTKTSVADVRRRLDSRLK